MSRGYLNRWHRSGKNVFVVHGVDDSGKPALVRPSVPRAKLLELIASLTPFLIDMEAVSQLSFNDGHLPL